MQFRAYIESLRPYFAELPYYVWGTVNYDSEGDCSKPTDRNWSWIELTNRDTGERVEIKGEHSIWTIDGDEPAAARITLFIKGRCDAQDVQPPPDEAVGKWNHSLAMARAVRVAAEFASPKLAAFDSHLFWGSWKWIGYFATDFTWTGRWIMHSVCKGDARGVPLCIDWLKGGTCSEEQSEALRCALSELTGTTFATDEQWVKWYEGGLFRPGAKRKFPKPDLEAWLAEMKSEYDDNQR